MRIGEFEFTDNGSNVHVKYVGKPIYLTTASPNNHPWIKELLNKWYGRHEFVYKAPPLEFEPVLSRKKIEELVQNSYLPDAVLPLSTVRTIIFKNEKETAMKKDIRDYIGCYVKDISFDPPYTTIVWEDGTSTSVFCKDEPYDSEKGFAMAVLKKLFGDEYYECMKEELTDHGAYEKDAKKVRYRIKKLTEEHEKLKKENEELSHSRLASENRTLTALNKNLADRNYELEQKIEKLKKENEELSELIKSETARADACRRDYLRMKDMYNQVIETNRKLHQDKLNLSTGYNRVKKDLDDHNKALEVLKERNAELIKKNDNLEKILKEFSDNRDKLRARIVRTETLYNNQCAVSRSLNGRIDDLKKAKENMAKKLAETKSLRQEIVRLKEENEELKIKLEDWINSFNYQSNAMNQLRCKCIDLEKENAKYKDIVDMQKQYDELKEQYDLLTKCHKRQAFTISKQREEVEKLNKIKEILK